jgi:uncharacterized protein YeaO (DUF488 family)
MKRGEVRLKRVYEKPTRDDGMRVLVDRLWPRGLSRLDAGADLWLKEVAPSPGLRRWFDHDVRRWTRFRARYRAELARHPDGLRVLKDLRRRGPVTLLFAARDEAHNHAVVLRETLDERGRHARIHDP